MAVFAIRNETSATCKRVFYHEIRFHTLHFQAVLVPGFRALKAVNHPANSGGSQKLKLNYNF